jgi:hypothetical protein
MKFVPVAAWLVTLVEKWGKRLVVENSVQKFHLTLRNGFARLVAEWIQMTVG